jgi:hypothetical protein
MQIAMIHRRHRDTQKATINVIFLMKKQRSYLHTIRIAQNFTKQKDKFYKINLKKILYIEN